MQDERAEVRMYSDYKSPYAYLAFDPGMALEEKLQGAGALAARSSCASRARASAASTPSTR